MIVVLILIGIVSSILGRILINGLHNSHKSTRSQQVSANVRTAVAQFGDDITGARAPDRTTNNIPDLDRMRRAILGSPTGSTATPEGVDPRTGRSIKIDVRDIVDAGPTFIEFRSDVEDTGQVRCIRYYVTGVRGNYLLHRRVSADVRRINYAIRTCAGALIEDQIVLGGVADQRHML